MLSPQRYYEEIIISIISISIIIKKIKSTHFK